MVVGNMIKSQGHEAISTEDVDRFEVGVTDFSETGQKKLCPEACYFPLKVIGQRSGMSVRPRQLLGSFGSPSRGDIPISIA